MTESLLALALSVWMASAPPPEDRIVCVPNDTDGWDCGKGANEPAPRELPPSSAPPKATPPPLYLMDPAQMPNVVRESLERGDYQTAQEASEHLPPPPQVVRNATPDPAPAAAPPPAEPVAPTPAPVASQPAAMPPVPATPEPATPEPERSVAETSPPPLAPAAAKSEPRRIPTANEALATPPAAPMAPPPVASTPSAAPSPSTPAAVGAPAPAPASVPPQRPLHSISSVARDAGDLLALPGDAYTVQLAAARGIQGFAAFRTQLGIAVEDTFVIEVRRNGETWWLMLWRDFPNLESARSAVAELPTKPQGIWPRRLAPLQAEVRATAGH